jgi:DNA-binding NtrC family response regulator
VVLCDTTVLDTCDFPQIASAMGVDAQTRRASGAAAQPAPAQPTASSAPHRSAPAYQVALTDPAGHMRKLEDLEAEAIRTAITRYDGHMSEVARRLGIGRSTLYRKLRELGLETDADKDENAEPPRHQVAAAGS